MNFETDFPTSPKILVADDEVSLRTVLAAILRREGFRVSSAKNGKEALDVLRNSFAHDADDFFDLLIADIKMPELDGIQLLDNVCKEFPDLPVIFLTAHGTVDLAVSALKKGAVDFITKPYEREDLVHVVRNAIAQHCPALTGKLLGDSQLILEIKEKIKRIANSPSTVLITGESGTGKELVAHALHDESDRRKAPFVRVNCAAIPDSLIESEFFGFEKGVLAHANAGKPGRFELANGGTLFLDEIGDLSFEVQGKLLRVLEDCSIERIGGVHPVKIDVRLIATTNHNLQDLIRQGEFREDLYYRINVIPIHLPPLRDRLEDIPALVQSAISKFNLKLGRSVEEFSSDAIALLKSHNWPGNIRELENIVERTILFSNKQLITPSDLPPEIAASLQPTSSHQTYPMDGLYSMKDIVKQATSNIERDLIISALNETNGNITQAAQRLKISRKGLQIKMKDLALREEDATSDTVSL